MFKKRISAFKKREILSNLNYSRIQELSQHYFLVPPCEKILRNKTESMIPKISDEFSGLSIDQY